MQQYIDLRDGQNRVEVAVLPRTDTRTPALLVPLRVRQQAKRHQYLQSQHTSAQIYVDDKHVVFLH